MWCSIRGVLSTHTLSVRIASIFSRIVSLLVVKFIDGTSLRPAAMSLAPWLKAQNFINIFFVRVLGGGAPLRQQCSTSTSRIAARYFFKEERSTVFVSCRKSFARNPRAHFSLCSRFEILQELNAPVLDSVSFCSSATSLSKKIQKCVVQIFIFFRINVNL